MLKKSLLSVNSSLLGSCVVLLMFVGIFTSTTSVAKADIISDMQAQIAALMAQIAALQGTVATTTTTVKASSTIMQIGTPITVTAQLRVRIAPGINSAFIATQPIGSTGVIQEGPIVKDGYNWYKVDYATGVDGWNIGAWLKSRTNLPDTLGYYEGFMNSEKFITTQSISRNAALTNCKLNSNSYPTKSVRCTWQGIEIFNSNNNLPTQTQGITVTVPNGGESWEMGVTNTVTWTPYSYGPDVNPPKDITAYLETKNADGSFRTLGKVQESGKASIHWPTGELDSLTLGGNYAPAGTGYYIRVVNNLTGATDRSDSPFTLLPKSVDLKVNGSDGPVSVGINEKVTLTWNTTGIYDCEIQNAYTDISRTTQIGAVSRSGSIQGYLHKDSSWGPTLYCNTTGVNSAYDSVKRTASTVNTGAVVKVLSPNGGENVDPKKPLTINYTADGVSSISVGLYKNNQWKAWIKKDLNVQTETKPKISFIPSSLVEGLGQGDNSGAIFKIYITGQLSSGTGYRDDKSDNSFSFATNTVVMTTDPGKNIFGCARDLRTGLSNGSLACYGMWDYGSTFGNDHFACGAIGSAKTGCVIKTPICTSGTAKATAYRTNSDLQNSTLANTVGSNMNVAGSVVSKSVAGMWEYSCIAAPVSTSTGAVLGATTDVYSEMKATLDKLSTLVKQIVVK